MRKLKKYKPTAFMAEGSYYDKDAADYAVSFIQALSHTKGSWAGKPFELIDWQEQIVRIFGILSLMVTVSSIRRMWRFQKSRANQSLLQLLPFC